MQHRTSTELISTAGRRLTRQGLNLGALAVSQSNRIPDEGRYGWAPPGVDRPAMGHESLGRVLDAPTSPRCVLTGRRTYDFEENAAVQRTGARELRAEAALGGNGIPTRQLLPQNWTLTQPCNL